MRDLAVAALIDVSRSTEAFVGERAVIDVEKEALIALSEGLAACQDDFALYAFSSLRRDRVWVTTLKDFKEPKRPRDPRAHWMPDPRPLYPLGRRNPACVVVPG